MRKAGRKALVSLVALGALALPASATAQQDVAGKPGPRGCVAKFDAAQRADMESFRDYDAETFRAVHDRDAVSVFPSGARFAGIDAIMDALQGHFEGKEALWSWTEINRRIDGCKSAFIEYEAVYEIPRIGFYQRAHTVVSYIYKRGEWLATLDQGTMLELRTGPTL
ncbi:MAG: hypothetical protein ACRDWI_09090 [Jiangellaceae bacterium]